MHFWLLSLLFGLAGALRCYDGTVDLDSNLRTKKKDCGISEYCIQKINKSTKKITRECSSFTDDHNMEEKCPMSGCHWQSSTETYCCCQFDLCNEYKADGSPFHEKEMKKAGETEKPKSTPSSRVSIKEEKLRATESARKTTSSSRKTDEIELED